MAIKRNDILEFRWFLLKLFHSLSLSQAILHYTYTCSTMNVCSVLEME